MTMFLVFTGDQVPKRVAGEAADARWCWTRDELKQRLGFDTATVATVLAAGNGQALIGQYADKRVPLDMPWLIEADYDAKED